MMSPTRRWGTRFLVIQDKRAPGHYYVRCQNLHRTSVQPLVPELVGAFKYLRIF